MWIALRKKNPGHSIHLRLQVHWPTLHLSGLGWILKPLRLPILRRKEYPKTWRFLRAVVVCSASPAPYRKRKYCAFLVDTSASVVDVPNGTHSKVAALFASGRSHRLWRSFIRKKRVEEFMYSIDAAPYLFDQSLLRRSIRKCNYLNVSKRNETNRERSANGSTITK